MNSEQRQRELEQTIERARAELSALADGTWVELTVSNNGVTPADLAQRAGISDSAANERLKRLWRVGLVTRTSETIVGGGRFFRYRLEDASRW